MSAATPIPTDAGALVATANDSELPPLEAVAAPAPLTLPEVGKVWLGRYDVQTTEGDVVVSRTWRAVRIDTMEPVFLRAVTMGADRQRDETWQLLTTVDHPNLLRGLDCHQVGSVRIEVQQVPTGEPLDTWYAQQKMEVPLIERLVRAIAGALGALHERGIVHFGVRPRNIFVRDENGAWDFVLGGLETAAASTGSSLVPVVVDPMNAPPEAAGLFKHSPGPTLQAWDWWSLGRVVQEVVMGGHVLGHLLQRDVRVPSPELLSRAEALLLERDPGATRAGAVEAMPAMDKRLEQLLRGLLTSARDARWDGDCVTRWLRRESVRELYRLPRNERMFRWRDRACTVAEAAEQMRAAEVWKEANENIWAHETPGTLAKFIADVPSHQALAARLEELRKLETAFALKNLPKDVVREAITAVALLEVAGGGALIWRGQKFDEEGFQKIFGAESDGIDRLGLLQAFTARPIVLLIERNDISAARVLAEFAHVAAGAEALARQSRWLTERDTAGKARLMRTALLSLVELRSAVKLMHDQFACSLDVAAEKLFKLPQPNRPELAALVWLGGDAVKRGFLTHVQWAERELARLRAAGAEEVANLGWLQLERALRRGPWLFARWRWLIPAWLLWAPAALILWPGPRWVAVAVAPLVLGILLRVAATFFLRREIKQLRADAAPWRLRDGPARCQAELGAYRAGRPVATVHKALDEVNAEIAKLVVLQPPPAPVAPPPPFKGVWAFSIASWVLFAAGLGVAGWWGKTHRPSWTAIVRAWDPPKPAPGADGKSVAKADDKPVGPVKISWPFKPGDDPLVLIIKDSEESTPAQQKFVAARGQKLADRYKVETINMLVILQVPVKEKFGLMIFDAATQQLVNTKVYLLDYAPLAKTWVEVAGRKGIYLPD